MRILVVPKKVLRTQWHTDRNWFLEPDRLFITISGLADDLDYPCEYLTNNSNPDKILKLAFDDITDQDPSKESLILFNEHKAKRIKEFIDSFKNRIQYWGEAELYINCSAGISRSGAVGDCLNEYINRNSSNIFYYNIFKEDNPQIQPNPYVKRILMKELFGDLYY